MSTNPEPDHQLQESIKLGYEAGDMRARKIALGAFMMMVAIPVIVVFVWANFRILAGPSYRGFTAPSIVVPSAEPTREYPEPRLVIVSGLALEQWREKEDRELNGYGWSDATQRTVRIPIKRAMQLTLQRGLPVARPGSTNLGPSSYQLIIERRQERDTEIKALQRKEDSGTGVGGNR